VTKSPNNRALDTAARCLATACLIAVIFITFRLFNGADTPFLAFSVIGAAVVYFADRPRWFEIAITAILAIALGIAYVGSRGVIGDFPGSGVIAPAAFLGLASMLLLAFKASRSTAALRPLLLATFCPALVILTNVALAAIIALQPRVYDLFLYRFDAILGGQASFVIGKWFAAWPMLANICFLVYAALPLAEVLVLLMFVRGQKMPANPLMVFVVAGVAGFALYQLCPATGPVHVFGSEFPNYPPSSLPLQSIQLDDVPRNAIPSLHSAWALLIWWSVRYSKKWIQSVATLFLAFTLLATLGLGEHYFIDLVVALPFAVAAMSACAGKYRNAAIAGALTVGWIVYLRFGLPAINPSPVAAWLAVLATIVASVAVGGGMDIVAGALPSEMLPKPETCATQGG
jgi:hypothetical protein